MALMLRHASIAGDGGGVDHVEVDAVGEHVAAADHQHLGRLSGGVAQRGGQSPALAGRHRPVVEVEAQHADVAVAPVADLPAPTCTAGPVERLQHLGHAAHAAAEGQRRPATSRPSRRCAPGRSRRCRRRCARARRRGGGGRSCPARRAAPARHGRRTRRPACHRASCAHRVSRRRRGSAAGSSPCRRTTRTAGRRRASPAAACRSRRARRRPRAPARTTGRPPCRPPRRSAPIAASATGPL